METGKLRQKVKVGEREETATFLTQVFKDSEVKRKDLDKQFPDWEERSGGQDISTQAKWQIHKYAKGEAARTQQKKVVAEKQRRESAV